MVKKSRRRRVTIYYASRLCEGALTKTSHEFYIEFNGILLIGNGRIQHANYCCIISIFVNIYIERVGTHVNIFIFILKSTFVESIISVCPHKIKLFKHCKP